MGTIFTNNKKNIILKIKDCEEKFKKNDMFFGNFKCDIMFEILKYVRKKDSILNCTVSSEFYFYFLYRHTGHWKFHSIIHLQ